MKRLVRSRENSSPSRLFGLSAIILAMAGDDFCRILAPGGEGQFQLENC